MPDLLKHTNGDIDYSKIAMGFAMALVLVLQQWQSYRLAEIKAQGEVNAIQFMKKDHIVKRLDHMDNIFMKKDELLFHLKILENKHGLQVEENYSKK